ncbi:hypothetical protein Javan425_0028 [Streptococcus phage Javan425]|nr:DUF1492 domain-containing protein [Streptococcus porcinus]EGJ27281.1 hypothetical protein STRPO_0277 [Streptococcus porcinus str. Jelinkova 176]QBX18378.1 hypothetical protein Javan423_0032 [Streptococcus phage Javan423]QBX18433.1 hypothetical protein Javan425_0028 [Streptococcus phage Javan425]SQG43975.1 phage protein [Streptococcus porcinus]
MGKNQTPKANRFINDLKAIPKLIESLERDSNIMNRSLIKSPQWNDMSVSGGVRKTQEDKNIDAIVKTDYYSKQIEELKRKKENMINIIIQNTGLCESHVLIKTIESEDSYQAMEKLDIGNRNKYFKILNDGKKSLELIL